jgi:D-alanyl-D-alanine carboxypeptidase (penicillin-binding protein 5/6)
VLAEENRIMRWYSIFSGILIVVLLAVGGLWWYDKLPQTELVSPVLGVSTSNFSENIWSPEEASASSFADAPEITGEAAFFVEANTGKVLYAKNPQLKKPIASLTKIMTVIIALDHKKYSDTFVVSKAAEEVEPDEMMLIAGEKMTLEELLSGIFLVSANDAAEVLAENITQNRAEFILQMNTKAKMLGMNNTLFINPTGLEEDDPLDPTKLKERFSTAYDVALMSRYLIAKYPDVVKISSSPHIYLPRTENHQDYELYSGINLLTTYPGVMGLKTGFTPEAGLTLVTLAKKGDAEVIGVLLNCTSRRDDAQKLLDYSFKKLGY